MGCVEAHRLGVDQSSAEGRRVVVLDPGTGVDEVGERHRMALWEPVVSKGHDLLPNPLGDVGRYPPTGRPSLETLP